MEKTEKKTARQYIVKILAKQALKRFVKRYCIGLKLSRDAAQEILHGLPGVFSMTLQAGNASLRLIKEADTFRIMRKPEKSANLLTLQFEDLVVLDEIVSAKCTIQKALVHMENGICMIVIQSIFLMIW